VATSITVWHRSGRYRAQGRQAVPSCITVQIEAQLHMAYERACGSVLKTSRRKKIAAKGRFCMECTRSLSTSFKFFLAVLARKCSHVQAKLLSYPSLSHSVTAALSSITAPGKPMSTHGDRSFGARGCPFLGSSFTREGRGACSESFLPRNPRTLFESLRSPQVEDPPPDPPRGHPGNRP